MKERFICLGTWISIFLLLPYLVTCIVNGAETAFVNKKFDVENSVPLLVSMQIPEDYNIENIKAQTVLARTNLYFELKSKYFLEVIQEIKACMEKINMDYVDKVINFFSYPHKLYQLAAFKTKNQVLTYNGEIKRIPYHVSSGGKTRDGEEVFRSSEYSYLKAVDSIFDKESEDYIYITYFSEEEFPGEIKVKERDQSGYVMSLTVDGNILEGESFRKGMNLPSSHFSLQKMGERYKVICKGVGHGLGFSQYGGNKLAENGRNWKEILNVYFPAMDIGKI